jgi:hypothetical protein
VHSLLSRTTLSAGREIFAFLAAVDPLPETTCDAVIGFGTFDVTLASFCGELYVKQRAKRIIFTGGFGAGTTDLGKPEADAWLEELARTHPEIPRADVVAENRSTNTAENIAFTADLLKKRFPTLSFGQGLNTALIVASPSRLRRVKLTLQLMQPAVQVFRCSPPETTFEHEYGLYEGKGLNYLAHLRGEVERLSTYPARGWIVSEPVPAAIVTACGALQ